MLSQAPGRGGKARLCHEAEHDATHSDGRCGGLPWALRGIGQAEGHGEPVGVGLQCQHRGGRAGQPPPSKVRTLHGEEAGWGVTDLPRSTHLGLPGLDPRLFVPITSPRLQFFPGLS